MVKCALAGKGTVANVKIKLKNWHIRGVCLPACLPAFTVFCQSTIDKIIHSLAVNAAALQQPQTKQRNPSVILV